MKNTSGNSSSLRKWIFALGFVALLLAGAFYFAPSAWKHSAKRAPAPALHPAPASVPAAPPAAPAPSRAAQRNPLKASTSPAHAAKPKASPVLTANASPHPPINPNAAWKLEQPSSPRNADGNGDRLGPDTGNQIGGETGEDPKQRANYFYYQRAYPLDHTPPGALQNSLAQLDSMIAQERSLGILPPADAPPPEPLSTGFPGPVNWTNLGPQPVTNGAGGANFGNPAATGRVTAIAVDPTTTTLPNVTVYLGAATGGVWKSTDGGATWNTIFDQNKSLAIGGIAIAPSDQNTIYVGTGELNFSLDSYYGAGIYKSTDGGTTWTQQCGGASINFCGIVGAFPFQGGGFYVGSIAVNPTNANIALAAVRDPGNGLLSGIYRTTDGGANWTQIASASGAAGNSIVWNPTDNTIVYATLGQAGNAANFGVYKSTDSGITFTKLTGVSAGLPTTNLGRHELAVAPSNGSILYVAINNNSTSGLLGFGKSIDAGATWTFTAPSSLPSLPNFCSGQCWYDMALAVLPTDPNTVIVGGSAFTNNSSTDFRTTDGGTTWTDITAGSTAVRPHVDTHAMKFANTGGGNFRLFTGNDGGIWFTDTPTAPAASFIWQAGNNPNLVITQFYPGQSTHPSDENISFGGTQDNGVEKYSGNLAWDHVTCGDGAWTAIDQGIPTVTYANCQNIQIVRSLSDGTALTWSPITNELGTSGDRSLFIPPLVQDRNNSGRLYFGTFRVWQSENYGNNWIPISPDISGPGNDVTSVTPSLADSNVVYASTSTGRIWRTTNVSAGVGAPWTELTKAPLPGRYATMVKTDDTNANVAYAGFSGFSGFVDSVGHIFKTSDGGTTWTDISGTAAGALPNTPVNDIVLVQINALSFTALFVATDVGVFECTDPNAATPCTTWTPVGTGLPRVPVVGLAYRENSATLRAVTHGRGVWIMETPGISASGLLLLTSITPSSKPLNSGSFVMSFDGNDFGVPSGNPQILVDGVDPGVSGLTLSGPNHMTATIPASVTASPGLHQISIMQPGHAAVPANPYCCLTFSVPGPAPTLTLISPNQANTGAASFPMTLTGTNFVCGNAPGAPADSFVQFGGLAILFPTTCSTTSMIVQVPASALTVPKAVTVTVFNPGPGGGTSAGQSFTIGSPAGNDNFANATAITSLPFSDTQSTGTATTEVGEPVPSATCTLGGTPSANTRSIWYSYTPASSGVVTFTSPGESEAGIIQVVTGTALGGLVGVPGGCSFDATTFSFPTRGAATVKVTGGVTYHIMLSDFNGTGGTSVLSAVASVPPANDDFANAMNVSTVGFTDSKGTTGATTEIGEPIPSSACTLSPAASTHSVWYKYIPGSSGTAVFNTNGSTIDSIIQVVTGGLGTFSAVTGGCADSNGQGVGESATFSVTSGTTYFIMVSDWNGIGGTSVLTFVSGPAPQAGGSPDLTVTKNHGGNFTQGQVGATYTIVVSNSGAAATTGTVTMVDTLPSGLTATAISGTGWTCTLGTLTCTRSDVLANPGSYPVITLTVNVANNANSSVTNTATVSGGGETNTANDIALDTTTIVPVADLTVAKIHAGNFTQGQAGATYTITVSNAGPGSTSGTVNMVDTLPAGLTATNIAGTGWACTLGTLTCTRNDVLAAAASYPAITLTVNVANNAAASVTNTATVSGGGELNTANDVSNDVTTINQVADLTVSKVHAGNFTQGQNGATYTITVGNAGPGSTSGTVTMVDTLPAGLTATAIAGTGWGCTLATLTCTRNDVLAAAGSYPAITLTVNVAGNANSPLTNTATVSGGGELNTANDVSNDVTTITPTAQDLTINKSHVGNFTQGQTGATYSLTVNNIGGTATSGTVNVVDTLPAGLTATNIAGTGWACTLGTLTCTRADVLAPAASYPIITLTVNVANNAAASVTNSATVSGGGETNVANDSANDLTTIIQVADMTVVKSHTGNFTQGQVGATYTITATNSGPGSTSGVVSVVDTLPASLTATAISGTGWACTLGTLTCTRNDVLAAAGSYPAITVTVNVANNAPASVTNTATISGGGELNTANDVSNDSTTINPVADMTIVGSHSGSFSQGQIGATYSLVATNSGVGPTLGTVSVVDALPSGLSATAIAGTGWACTLATLTCTRNDVLAPAASYQAITVTVNVANNANASVTNTATVSGGGELNLANDSSSDVTTVILASDMTITKIHAGNFTQGQTGATYTITVSNGGGGASSGSVNVADTLPASLTATSITGTGWVCTLGTVSCTRSDSLPAAGSYPAITLTVNVANNAPASVTNSVAVSGGSELNTANDTATDPTTITQVADLSITKVHTGNFTQGQNAATYTITVSNAGPGPTSAPVSVVDTLPAGLTATNIAGTGWGCILGTLTCTRNDVLAVAGSYPAITLTVNVAANAAPAITNTATVSGGGELNVANDTANDLTTVIPAVPDLTITKVHVGNFNVGQVGATYTITVTNNGTIQTDGSAVTVVDTLPAGLTATAISGTGWACTLATLTCTRSDVLAVAGSYPAITLTVNVAANAAASVTNSVAVSGGGETNVANDVANDPTTITRPDMTITKIHAGNFNVNQVGATYTITATNSGNGATSGTVTVVDTLPADLTATAMSGTGWACTLGTLTCTRNDVLAPATAYPAITLTVNVSATAAASITNNAAVSGGGELNLANDAAADVTTVTRPDLTITKTHVGNFAQNQVGASYTITVTNSGNGATTGTVTVVDTPPASLTATAISGTGWTCTLATLTCTRADVLAAAGAYPAITLTVNVAINAPASVTNTATVSGGGELNVANDAANDVTTVLTLPAASLSAATLTYTAQPVATPTTKSVTVTNNGGTPLVFGAVAAAITGTNAADFAVAAGTTCTNNASIAPTASCTVVVSFTPGAAGARGPATLTLTNNASPTTQTVTLNGTGIDYSVAGPGTPVVVTAGATANFTITVTPGAGGFANAVTFTASGLPAKTTGAFNPTSVTPGGASATTTLSIATTVGGGTSLPFGTPQPRAPQPFVWWSFAGALALITMMFTKLRTGRRPLAARVALVAIVLLMGIGIAGCAKPAGTPLGTSTITVTATSGSDVHTTTVTLTVQ